MKDERDIIADIEEELRHLPERELPPGLHGRIMRSLPQRQQSLQQRIIHSITEFIFNWPKPLAVAVASFCLLAGFYGGVRYGSPPTAIPQFSNADASFYLGRSLLAAGEPKEALLAFQQAQQLGPKNPKYTLWQAASFYALGDRTKERQSYEAIISQNPDFVPARLNLAHNLLEEGQFEAADLAYQQVLKRDPAEQSALYNRGLVLHLQDKTAEERMAWKHYLSLYRTGTKAFRAVQYLQNSSDYSYRIYQLGYRRIILNQSVLLDVKGSQHSGEIRFLAAQFATQPEVTLDLVVFHEGDVLQARKTALTLREELEQQLSEKETKEVRISWFGEAETIEKDMKEPIRLAKGVLLFSTPGIRENGERI